MPDILTPEAIANVVREVGAADVLSEAFLAKTSRALERAILASLGVTMPPWVLDPEGQLAAQELSSQTTERLRERLLAARTAADAAARQCQIVEEAIAADGPAYWLGLQELLAQQSLTTDRSAAIEHAQRVRSRVDARLHSPRPAGPIPPISGVWCWRLQPSRGVFALCQAKLQTATGVGEGNLLKLYQGEDGRHWLREVSEFLSRFDAIHNFNPRQWRHRRTQGLYNEIGEARVMDVDRTLVDMEELVVHTGPVTGRFEVRTLADFLVSFESNVAKTQATKDTNGSGR